jgi:hypothetical protein
MPTRKTVKRSTAVRKRPTQSGRGPVLNFLRSKAGRAILGKAITMGASVLSKKVSGDGLRLAGSGAKAKKKPRRRR